MANRYSDNFAGAAGNLTTPWVQGRSNTTNRALWQDGSGSATTHDSSNVTGAALYVATIANDQFSEIQPDWTASGDTSTYLMLFLRVTNAAAWYEQSTQFYRFYTDFTETQIQLAASGGSSVTVLSSNDGVFNFSPGDTIRFQIVGTQLKVLKNGVEVTALTVTDATLSTGYVGVGMFRGLGQTRGIDNWAGGDVNQTAAMGAGSLTLTGTTPAAVTTQVIRAPGAGALAFTGAAPALVVTPGGTVVQPSAGSLTLTGTTNVVHLDQVRVPNPGLLTLAGNAPTVIAGAGMTVAPSAGTLSLTGDYVSLVFDGPASGTLTLTGVAPAVVLNASAVIGVPVGSLTLTGVAPTAITSGVTRAPLVGSLTLTGATPALQAAIMRAPAAGSVTLTGTTPAVLSGITVIPSVGALTLTGVAPSAVLSSNVIAQPAAGTLTLTGVAPALHRDFVLTPAGAVLTLTGVAPTLTSTVLAQMQAGSLTLTGVAPSILSDLFALPLAGALHLTGVAPAAQVLGPFTPGSGDLTLTGRRPIVKVHGGGGGGGASGGSTYRHAYTYVEQNG